MAFDYEYFNLIIADGTTGDIIGRVEKALPQFLEEIGNEGSGSLTLPLGEYDYELVKRNIVHIHRGSTYVGSWILDKPEKSYVNANEQQMVTWSGPGLRKWMEDGDVYPIGSGPEWDANTPKTRDFNFTSITYVPGSEFGPVTVMSRQDAQSILGIIDVASAVTSGGDPNSAPSVDPLGAYKIPGWWFSPGYQVYFGSPILPVGPAANWWDITGFQPVITDGSSAPLSLFGMNQYPQILTPGYVGYGTVDAVTGAWTSAFPLVWWNGQFDTDTQVVEGVGTIFAYTLTYAGQTTVPIPTSASLSFVLAALEALSTIGAGNVVVEAGPSDALYAVVFDPAGVTKAENVYIPKMTAKILAAEPGAELLIINAGTRNGSGARIAQNPVAVDQPPPPDWTDLNPWRSLPSEWPTATAAHARWIWTEDVRGTENAVQTLTQVGSGLLTFNITFDGHTTGSLNWNDSPATVQTALESLVNISSGDVVVSNVPGFIAGSPLSMVVEFGGAYSSVVVPVMTTSMLTEVSDDSGSIAVFATSFKANVAQGTSYFRKAFTLPDGPPLQYSLFMAAEDGFTAYIDGAQVSQSSGESNFFQTTRIDIPLDQGDHVIGFKVTNNSIGGGLLVALISTGNVTLGTTAQVIVISDSSWIVDTRPTQEPGFTAGEVLLQFLHEASDRGVPTLVRLVPTFTQDVDSYGNAWDEGHDWSFDVGSTFRSVVEKMEELVCDVEIKYNITHSPPQYEINAYVKQGVDKTADVIFSVGQAIMTATEGTDSFGFKSDLLVQYGQGYFQWPQPAASSPTYGRVEGFLPTSGSEGFAQSVANLTLQELGITADGATIEFASVQGVLPWSDFQLGDMVTGPRADGTYAGRRVMSMSFTLNPENAAEVQYAVEFDTISQAKIQDLQRKIASLQDNGLTGTVVNASVPAPGAAQIGAFQGPSGDAGVAGGTAGDDSPAGYGSGKNKPASNQKQYFDKSGNMQNPGNSNSKGDVKAGGEVTASSMTVGGVHVADKSGTLNAPNITCDYINNLLYNAVGVRTVQADTTIDSTMFGQILEIAAAGIVKITLPKLTAPRTRIYDNTQQIVGQPGLTSFTLTFDGQTTTSLSGSATASQVQAALSALSSVGGLTNVTVVGTTSPINMVVTFTGAFAGKGSAVPIMTSVATPSADLATYPILQSWSQTLDVYLVGPGSIQFIADPTTSPTVRTPYGSNILNAAQTITISGSPTGGTFTLSLSSVVSAPIAFNASASTVQAALQSMANIGSGNAIVTGGPGPGTAWTVTFAGMLAQTNVADLVAAASFTGGSNVAIAVNTSSEGGLYLLTQYTSVQLRFDDAQIWHVAGLWLSQEGTRKLFVKKTAPDPSATRIIVNDLWVNTS